MLYLYNDSAQMAQMVQMPLTNVRYTVNCMYKNIPRSIFAANHSNTIFSGLNVRCLEASTFDSLTAKMLQVFRFDWIMIFLNFRNVVGFYFLLLSSEFFETLEIS